MNDKDFSPFEAPTIILSGFGAYAVPSRFSGKERLDRAGLPLYDFGARWYNPATPAWTTPDPLAEKYYDFSPYAYCAGNPVNLVDPDGQTTRVVRVDDGSYMVVGGGDPFDGDNSIIIGYYDDNQEWIETGYLGKSLTNVSFFNTDYNTWSIGAIIDANDMSGIDFILNHEENLMPLGDYMLSATNGNINDFKVTNGSEGVIRDDFYRGMRIGYNTSVYASARDIGNYVAGYYAAANGFAWERARWAFDTYQGSEEGFSTQAAQYAGFLKGLRSTTTMNMQKNFHKSIPSLVRSGLPLLLHKLNLSK